MFLWLLQNTVLAALLAGGVAVLCRWRRCGPALRHALWVLVLLRLMLPAGVLTWPWRLPMPMTPAAPAVVTEAPAAVEVPASSGVLDGIEYRRLDSVGAEEAATVEPETPTVIQERVRWWIVAWWAAAGLWALGAIVVAASHLRGLARLLRLVRLAEQAPPGLVRRVGEMAAKLGIRPPRVRVAAGLPSPLVAGLLRPVLLWPKELQDRLSEDGLKAVLIHELAHLRRRDHWVRWIEMAASCLWWWNPLFRLARRRVRQYSELACDAWVMTVLPRARRAYAEALLQVCETVSRTSEPAPILGIAGDPTDIQRRLTMIMRESVSCRVPRRALVAVGVLALLVVPGWSLGEPPAEPTAPATVPERIELRVEGDDVLFGLLEIDMDDLMKQPDREQKLADLEAQIQALLKDLRALKSSRPTGKPASSESVRIAAVKALSSYRLVRNDAKLIEATKHSANLKPGEVLMLRVIYPLANVKGEALAKFLRENVRGNVVECAVAGDRLTVTASPESQTVIGKLVQLVQDLPAKPLAK